MDRCFVIQPFDNDKFDKRFEDVFEPAIINANLEPYRIDRDFSVKIPIEDIEKGIRESKICFAEITLDNPNVWYELGYAFACGKDVVMVSSDERNGKFPFDIQHRQVLTYKTSSKSDFELLEEKITKKLNALIANTKTVQELNSTPIIATEGLKSHEVAFLILLTENAISSDDSIPVYILRSSMTKSGYTDIATSVAIRTLVKKDMITISKQLDNYNDGEYNICRLTEKGESWILSNQDQLQFRLEENQKIKSVNHTELDDLPF